MAAGPDEERATIAALARLYEQRYARMPAFHVPRNDRGTTCSISFVALAASLDHRDRVGQALAANGIETRPLGGGSMGRQPFWAQRFGARTFDVADAIHTRSFMLPNHPDLSADDVNFICDVVESVPVRVRPDLALARAA